MAEVVTLNRVVRDVGDVKNAGKIEDGVLRGIVTVGQGTGGASVKIDGENNRLVIHDGTTNRIVIGNV